MMSCHPLDCGAQPCFVPPHPDHPIWRTSGQKERSRKVADTKSILSNQQSLLEPHGSALLDRPVGFNDGTIVPPVSWPRGTPAQVVRRAALREPLWKGVINVAVVLVYFPDQKNSPTAKNDMQDLFFSKNTRKNGSLNDYLYEVSGGIISSVEGQVYGPYELPQKSTWYANDKNGMDTTKDAPSLKKLADDTVSKLVADTVDLRRYDHKHRAPGWIDTLVIVHAGKDGSASTSTKDDLWSCKWSLDKERVIYEGTDKQVKISPFMTIPDTAELGVTAHEFGHLAFGWPDLYDVARKDNGRGIGYWCLMGMGSWGGNPAGTVPPHPSAWCKVQQGWVNLIEDSANGNVSINEPEAVLQKLKGASMNPKLSTVRKLWSNGDTSGTEYFLVENRLKIGYDVSLPGEGLLVWHIDDTLDDNNSTLVKEGKPVRHYHVALMTANGETSLTNCGNAGNPFPGTGNVTSFKAPQSNSWANSDTYISLSNIITAPGRVMKMALTVSPPKRVSKL